MTRGTVLRAFELGLFAGGAVLIVYCAIVLIGIERTRQMPVPPPPLTITQSPPVEAAPAPPPTPGTWIGRLEAPSVQMVATVLEGSDEATLRRAAGHLEDTPLPGQPGNIGIAGHRDTIFRPLRGVQVGDPLDLTTRDHVYHFRVATTKIVEPDEVSVLDPTSEPTLTLVTCYPFAFIGHAPRRFIVQARLVHEELRIAQASTPTSPRP
jgi:sortase A